MFKKNNYNLLQSRSWLFIKPLIKGNLIIPTLCMYSNSLRITQSQEIKNSRSLIVICSHISPNIYWSAWLTLLWFSFRHANLFTFALSIPTSSLTMTPAHKNQNFHHHLISASHASIHWEQVTTTYRFPLSIMQFYLFNN